MDREGGKCTRQAGGDESRMRRGNGRETGDRGKIKDLVECLSKTKQYGSITFQI